MGMERNSTDDDGRDDGGDGGDDHENPALDRAINGIFECAVSKYYQSAAATRGCFPPGPPPSIRAAITARSLGSGEVKANKNPPIPTHRLFCSG